MVRWEYNLSIKVQKKKFLILSWASYDMANQFFALNIVSLYFPRWLAIEKNLPEIFYSLSFGISMFLVAVFAPILGSISDMKSRHKTFLLYFTFVSIIFTMSLGLSHNIFLALLFFIVANFGCQEAIIFYNALIIRVSPKGRIGFVSGLGRMFGYSGAILALYLTKPVVLKMGYQAAFLFTGILFLIFSLPCLIFIKEKSSKEKLRTTDFLNKENLLEILGRLKSVMFNSYKSPKLRYFLIASFFGLCAVNAILLFMAIYATRVFGLAESQVINLIAFSTIFAITGSLLSGFISDIIGYRKALLAVFFLWGICILTGALLGPPFHWIVGALAGMSLGPTWVISRALVVKIVPEERIGEAFGLFNLVGYVSGIIGPLFWSLILLCFSGLGERGYRLTFLSLILFIATGFFYLLKMTEKNEK